MRKLLKQARDVLYLIVNPTTSETETFTDGYNNYLEKLKTAHEVITAINAELAKPEEKIVPLAMLKECGPDWHGIYLSDEALEKVAAKYGYKVV